MENGGKALSATFKIVVAFWQSWFGQGLPTVPEKGAATADRLRDPTFPLFHLAPLYQLSGDFLRDELRIVKARWLHIYQTSLPGDCYLIVTRTGSKLLLCIVIIIVA